MAVEYAWRGLVGVLTPQANTTVEPELAILMPPGVAVVAARMVSSASALDDRLHDYIAGLAPACAQFANAPLGAVAFACTGASYLAGHAREGEVIAAAERVAGVPVITSARCVLDALHALAARRIGLVSPYGGSLTQASVRYWQAAGFDVGAVVEVTPDRAGFHPIYTLHAGSVLAALDHLADMPGFDAVVVLGTGLPSLAAIHGRPRVGVAPVLSCNLATAWRCVLALGGLAPDRDGLLRWIFDPEWTARLLAGRPPAAARQAA